MLRSMTISFYRPGYTGEFCPDICTSWKISREDHSNGYPVYSQVFICPVCLVQWAKLSLESDRFWCPVGVPCVAHPEAFNPDLRPVPGSILAMDSAPGIDEPLLNS